MATCINPNDNLQPNQVGRGVLCVLILMVAVFKSLLIIGAVPPWQSADEPTHYEAVLLHGRGFPFHPPSTGDPDVQQRILASMEAFHFWKLIGVPQPIPPPSDFRSTPFLDVAPSKIGRSPLYYMLAGVATHLWSFNLIAHLMMIRIFNLALMVCGLTLTFYSMTRTAAHDRFSATVITLALIHLPGFLYSCCTVNTEAWSFALSSLGLWLLVNHTPGTLFKRAVFWVWVASSLLTHWRILLIMLPIALFFTVSLFRDQDREQRSQMLWILFSGLILVSLGIMILIHLDIGINKDLMYLELSNGWSGVANIASNPGLFWPMLVPLFTTFFAGFGWLTVPVDRSAMYCFSLFFISSVWLVFRAMRGMARKGQTALTISFLVVLLGLSATLLRGFADEGAIQGRYLYPLIPFSAFILFNGVLNLVRTKLSRSLLPIACLLFLLPGDQIATWSGWYTYFHLPDLDKKPTLKALSNCVWADPSQSRIFLDLGVPETRIFMNDGWYPDENSVHVWFRTEAAIRIPLLETYDYRFRIRLLPFLHPEKHERLLDVYLDGQPMHQSHPAPGWSEISFIGRPLPDRPFAELLFRSDSAESPYYTIWSVDRRVISFGIDWIQIDGEPESDSGMRTGLLVTSSKGIQIKVLENQGFRLRSQSNRVVRLITRDGIPHDLRNYHPVWTAKRPIEIQNARMLVSLESAGSMLRSMIKNVANGLWGRWASQRLQFGFIILSLIGTAVTSAFCIVVIVKA